MKMLFLILMLLPAALFARSSIVSAVPLPKTYVINLDPYACDEACLADLVKHEQVFSFLAQMPEPVEERELNEERLIYVSLFNLDTVPSGGGVRFAMLLPEQVIGRYAESTTDSVMAYLLGKHRDFELKTFRIGDESDEAIRDGLEAIEDKGIRYVIAPLTKRGAETVTQLHPRCNVFFPTVNINDLNDTDADLADRRYVFGGIDYQKQIALLMDEAVPPLVVFYDQSELGNTLKNDTVNAFYARFGDTYPMIERQIFTYAIDKQTTNLKHILAENEALRYGTVVLNTPLVKSGMIMSQLTLYDVNASRVLSTQIAYNNMLFDITQPQDREHMIVANAIGSQNSVLVEGNTLLQNDIRYDWINYATTLGIDYFYHLATQTPQEYNIPFSNGQIAYPTALLQAGGSRFEPYVAPVPETEDASPLFY